jgi:hypothetical protein
VLWLLESLIERSYLARGVAVEARVRVKDHASVPDIAVYRRRDSSGSAPAMMRVAEPLRPTAEAFREVLEGYRRSRQPYSGWQLAVARAMQVEPDHTLLRFELSPGQQTYAVLPKSRMCATDDSWPIRERRWVAVCSRAPPSWGVSDLLDRYPTYWIATRGDSLFLRLLAQYYLGDGLRAEIACGTGMLVLSSHADLHEAIGCRGTLARALAKLAGLHRLLVVRELIATKPERRLSSAVRQVTDLRSREFRLECPGDGASRWTITVSRAVAPRLIGRGGVHLQLIARLTGLPITWRSREH